MSPASSRTAPCLATTTDVGKLSISSTSSTSTASEVPRSSRPSSAYVFLARSRPSAIAELCLSARFRGQGDEPRLGTRTHLHGWLGAVRPFHLEPAALLIPLRRVAHGGTEMGQGLYVKCLQIAAQELRVPMEAVFTSESATNAVPNAVPTAGSAGSDLQGFAVHKACVELNTRLESYRLKLGPDAPLSALAGAAWGDRISLSATGQHATPDLGYEWGCVFLCFASAGAFFDDRSTFAGTWRSRAICFTTLRKEWLRPKSRLTASRETSSSFSLSPALRRADDSSQHCPARRHPHGRRQVSQPRDRLWPD